MQSTLKLYETDATLLDFTAAVLTCTPAGEGWAVVLDRTAFYPEGGGQPCDTGRLGDTAVSDVRVQDGVITHHTDAPLTVGETVKGSIDAERRLDCMQQHTGEHILSGVLHRLYGAENVGFHIGPDVIRMDTDLPLTPAQLAEAERQANAAVRDDTPVHCHYPDAATLADTAYRSKKALDGPVRLVEAGGDVCACCGTHLARTGQVGSIKILSAQNYKGGVRLAVVCGRRATDAVAGAWADAEAAGRLVSSAPGRLADPVARLQAAQSADKMRLAALQNALADAWAAAALPGRPLAVWVPGADGDGLRRIANAVTAKTAAPCLACAAGGVGTAYALAHPQDARTLCQALNAALQGRGGGKGGFCQGSFGATEFAVIEGEFARQTE